MSDEIRVIVVDDQLLMRDGLASLLNFQPKIEVVGSAENGKAALTLIAETQPDVVLMDVQMPVMNGIEATAEIARQFPAVRVLMLTTFDDEAYITGALQAGAYGYVLKNTPALDLALAVEMAHRGIVQLTHSAALKVAKQPATPAMHGDNPLQRLTDRELEVLKLVVQGDNNREIAEKLVITAGTVKSHISNILNRLEARDRTQAAVIAVRHGLQ
ncbi:MAG: response regulator transcription factor [Pseudomonadota bacterium]